MSHNYGDHPGQDDHIINQALAILECRQRHLGQAFTHPNAAADFLRLKMGEYEREVFAIMLLDNQHRLLDYQELFFGTINAGSVYPREVVKAVLGKNAAAVILAHNHPSGMAEPSDADKAITARLKEVLEVVDVQVLDHFVVGQHDVVSFAERGLI
ncbi:RadC family protein [Aeromonas crassostreae]|uniref:DNA repair protein RadC n=2 Tax=Aeromonas rivipollensis TaxID=948519 RepID=A0AAW9YAL9_9GAMM|nr:DNA repair protein RadC [Aeromonas rivipollensis]NEX74882.1 DNA repair protein RadC [Aeromonas rivipollensis]